MIVSERGAKDPCAEGVHSYPPERVLVPFTGARARFVSLDGDTVVFENGDGVQRSFNFVSATIAGATQSTPASNLATLTPAAGARVAPVFPTAAADARTATQAPVQATPAPVAVGDKPCGAGSA